MFKLLFAFSALFALFTLVFAAPLQSEARTDDEVLVVVDPQIISPNAKTVWVVGNTYTVTWNVSSIPPLVNITNVVGQVVLGQFNGDGEKLYQDNPLATGFLLTDGQVSITVPDVADGNYMVVLEGDSGNTSPQFKIEHNPLSSLFGSSSSSSGTSSSSASTSSTTSGSLSASGSGPSGTSQSTSLTSPSTSSTFSASVPPISLSAPSAPTTVSSPTSSSSGTSSAPSVTQTSNSAASMYISRMPNVFGVVLSTLAMVLIL